MTWSSQQPHWCSSGRLKYLHLQPSFTTFNPSHRKTLNNETPPKTFWSEGEPSKGSMNAKPRLGDDVFSKAAPPPPPLSVPCLCRPEEKEVFALPAIRDDVLMSVHLRWKQMCTSGTRVVFSESICSTSWSPPPPGGGAERIYLFYLARRQPAASERRNDRLGAGINHRIALMQKNTINLFPAPR